MLDSVKLTPEQQKLVEDNHNLIYYLAQLDGISIDDNYGVLAIGLCKAAHYYNPGRGSFANFAVLVMRRELSKANNIGYRVKRGGRGLDREGGNKSGLKEITVLSYDEIIKDLDSNVTYKDCLRDDTDYADDVIGAINAEWLKSIIGDSRTLIFIKLNIIGYSLSEIARAYGISRQAVDQAIKRERKKIKAAMRDGNSQSGKQK